MSNPLSIQAGPPIIGAADSIAPRRSNTPPQTSPSQTEKPVQVFVNPNFRFDPSVGLLVIEFHDDTGTVTSSIPSQRQLEAYRTHQETPPGAQFTQPAPTSSPPTTAPTAPGTADGKTPAG